MRKPKALLQLPFEFELHQRGDLELAQRYKCFEVIYPNGAHKKCGKLHTADSKGKDFSEKPVKIFHSETNNLTP